MIHIRISYVDQSHSEFTNKSDLIWPRELGLLIAFVVDDVRNGVEYDKWSKLKNKLFDALLQNVFQNQ